MIRISDSAARLIRRKRLLLGIYQGLKLISVSSLVVVSGLNPVRAVELPTGTLPVASQTLRQAWRNASSSIDATGRNMTIDTVTGNPNGDNSILWWDSFNISADSRVEFIQPSSSHIALNRIARDTNPSIINGRLVANGHVYLINPNGILFGRTSSIDVNRLVASSLALNVLDDNDFIAGNSNIANLINDDRAAFANVFATRVGVDANGDPVSGVQFDNYQAGQLGSIVIEFGARITTPENGSVFIFGPQIFQQGEINTPGGQTILAASDDRVYLTPSTDTELRGFLVEVSSNDLDLSDESAARIEVGETGMISADRGNITLAGLSINHQGVLQATTSVNENGTIRLVARDQASITTVDGQADNQLLLGYTPGEGLQPEDDEYAVAHQGGDVRVDGRIKIDPEAIYVYDEETEQVVEVQVPDQQVQAPSRIEITGKDVTLAAGTDIEAASAEVVLHATATPDSTARNELADRLNTRDDSSIIIEDGARIDVSGTTEAQAAMSRNQLNIRATADFLRDAPQQREGVLRNQPLQVDARYGTPLGDISPVVDNIDRGIQERLGRGGDINILSQGGVLVQQGSQLDASGGWLTYESGFVTTSQLATSDRRIVNVTDADIGDRYVAVSSGSVTDTGGRWGIDADRSWQTFGGGETRYYQTYQHGLDAGSINIETYAAAVEGDLLLQSSNGIYQRDGQGTARSDNGHLNIILGRDQDSAGAALGFQNVLITDRIQQLDESRFRSFLDQQLSDDADWVLALQDDMLNRSGLGHFNLRTSGRFDVDASAQLAIAAGRDSSASNPVIDVRSGGAAIDGRIQVPGGDVSIATWNPGQSITVDGAIDVSGQWINDLQGVPNRNLLSSVQMDGGGITLASEGDLLLSENAVLRANGGGWMQSDGRLRAGDGGEISLSINQRAGSDIQIEGSLQAYALGRGGKLGITANEINIVALDGDADIVSGGRGELQIDGAFFDQGGFADFELVANINGLTIADDIAPQTRSLQITTDLNRLTSNSDLVERLPHIVRDTYYRSSNRITLEANRDAAVSGAVVEGLRLLQGVHIDLDAPESELTLIAGGETDLVVDADSLIRAPGGHVSLITLGELSAVDGYLGNQALWLNGNIDVSGRFVRDESVEDAVVGRLYNGGEVNIIAGETDSDTVNGSGFVFFSPDSHIDIQGATHSMDVLRDGSDLVDADYGRQTASSRAGSVNIYAAEGMILNGEINALDDNAGAGAWGGSVSLILDSAQTIDSNGDPVSREARVFNIYEQAADRPDAFAMGTRLALGGTGQVLNANDSVYVGDAHISNDWFQALDAAGVTRLSLRTGQPYAGHSGQLQFHGDVNMHMGQSLQLLVPLLRGDQGRIDLSAPYVRLGSSDFGQLVATAQASSGNSVLNVQAQGRDGNGQSDGLLEISGELLTQSMRQVNLSSAGDIRFRGLLNSAGERFEAGLTTYDQLNLRADQVYASTLTRADINVLATDGRINVLPGDSAGASILSAGSHLSFNATRINQSGVIKAPLGQISFNAGDVIDLNAGSVTSVSGEGQIVPFGVTRGELEWIYPLRADSLGNSEISLRSTDLLDRDELLTSRAINLNSDRVNLHDGALVDLNAGALDAQGQIQATDNLYAWEFVPGLGGSTDTLYSENNNGAFAVLPASDSYSPYDFVFWEGTDNIVNPGEQIYLQGSSQLEAGLYTVLPARYALLPGASLVTPVAPQSDYVSNQQILFASETRQQRNGAQVIAGQQRYAGTAFSDSNWLAYRVEGGDIVRSRSEYVESMASQFFRDQATREDMLLPAMPEDGGTLNLQAGSEVLLEGDVQGRQGEVAYRLLDGTLVTQQGRGSEVNIAATELAVVDAHSTNNPNDVEIRVADLNQLDVASIMLGGVRSRTSGGTVYDVTADTVTVDNAGGAELQVRDLILAATDTVTVAADSSIRAVATPGAQDEVALLDENGALLRISAYDQMRVVRDADAQNPSGGTLLVADSATLTASGSILVDADVDSQLQGELNFVDANGQAVNQPHGSLYLGSSLITLGRDDVGTGIALTQDQIQNWNVGELVLASRTQLDLWGNPQVDPNLPDLRFNDLTILSASIQGHQAGGEQFVINTNTLSLGSLNNYEPGVTATGGGDLVFNTDTTRLLDGDVTLEGFNDVTMNARRELIAARSNGFVFADGETRFDVTGDVTINAGRMTAESNVNQRIATVEGSSSPLLLNRHADALAVDDSQYLGGGLSFSADQLQFQGHIELHSGTASLLSRSSDLQLASGSVIDVSGLARDFAGQIVYSYGGDVQLTALQQNIQLADTALIDVSSAVGADGSGADAGRLKLSAVQGEVQLDGELRAGHGVAAHAGEVDLDVDNIADFNALNSVLNNTGFTYRRVIRQRNGDLQLGDANGQDIIAEQLVLSTDNGQILLQGQIDARAADGGRVELSASNGIEMQATASIDVSATDSSGDGGRVMLETCAGAANPSSCSGTLNLLAGSIINSAGGANGNDGRIHFRVPRLASNNGVLIQSLDGDLNGFQRLDIEGYQRYASLSELNTAYTEASNFMSNDVLGALGLGTRFDTNTLQRVHLRPGIDMTSATDLNNNSEIDFATTTYTNQLTGAQESGVFTLRSGGNLNINASIQDGITSEVVSLPFPGAPSVNVERLLDKDSWSYRLIAGADLTAARTLQVVDGGGDLQIATGRKLRTGTGDIDIAVGGQLRMASDAAIYTAGRPAQINPRSSLSADLGGIDSLDLFLLPGIEFPVSGGDVSIAAKQGIDASVDSFVSADWLHRIGGVSNENTSASQFGYMNASNQFVPLAERPVIQGVSLINFNHGVGALGGGDVRIETDGDVNQLAVSIPQTVKPVDEFDFNLTSAQVYQFILNQGPVDQYSYELNGGGDIDVYAGGDISQSMFLADQGRINVTAGGQLGVEGNNRGVLVSAAQTEVSLQAGSELNLIGITNTSRASMSSLQGAQTGFASLPIISAREEVYFNSYSDDSSLNLLALGDVNLQNRLNGTSLDGRAFASDMNDALVFYPASLDVTSFDGDINVLRTFAMTPSSQGNLSLLANDNLTGLDVEQPSVAVYMLDFETTQISQLHAPVNDMLSNEGLVFSDALNDSGGFDFASTPLHINNNMPVRIIAREGDIRVGDDARAFFFALPKQAEMIAGRDIRGVGLVNQHLDEDDVTLVQAGRDIRYIDSRSTVGASGSEIDYMGIKTGGPGMLQVLAGRQINLGDRQGIVVEGDTRNAGLRRISEQGADLYVMAGLGEQGADLQSFFDYLFPADVDVSQLDYAAELIGFVSTKTQQNIVDFNVALDVFRQMPSSEQRAFLTTAFFREIAVSAQRAAAELSPSRRDDVAKLIAAQGNAGRLNEDEQASRNDRLGYSRGLQAIETLFPGTIVDQSPAQGVTRDDDVDTLISAGQIYQMPVINPAYSGDIALTSSVIKAQDQGSDVLIAAPGGLVNVGLSVADGDADDRGIIARGDGNIGIFAHNDVSVNESRIQALSGGDIVIWSSKGNVDAGRGATTLRNVPPPVTVINPNTGEPETVTNVTVQGSGIRATSSADASSDTSDDNDFNIGLPTTELSNVVLAAPDGVIDAGDAGIDSNNLSLATETVLNANNIETSGESVGVPSADAGAISLPAVDPSALGDNGDSELVAQDASEQFGAGSVAILRVEVIDLEEDSGAAPVDGQFKLQGKPGPENNDSSSVNDDQASL